MIELSLSEQEFQALIGLIDAGIRATGIRGAKDAHVLIIKLEAALQASQMSSLSATASKD